METADEPIREKLSLIRLGQEHQVIIQEIVENEGEVSDELMQELCELTNATEAKVEAYSWIMKRMKHEAEFWKEEGDSALKKADGLAGAVERMREALKIFMLLNEKDSAEGISTKFKLVESGKSVDVDGVDLDSLPPELVKVSRSVNKTELKKALERGDSVPGATLTPSYQLREYKKELQLGYGDKE